MGQGDQAKDNLKRIVLSQVSGKDVVISLQKLGNSGILLILILMKNFNGKHFEYIAKKWIYVKFLISTYAAGNLRFYNYSIQHIQRSIVQYFCTFWTFLKVRTKTFGCEFKYWLCVPTHTQEIAFAAKKQKTLDG